jgi:hypothetical protein
LQAGYDNRRLWPKRGKPAGETKGAQYAWTNRFIPESPVSQRILLLFDSSCMLVLEASMHG